MLIGLSMMTTGSIMPSIGMFTSTVSTLAAKSSAAVAGSIISRGPGRPKVKGPNQLVFRVRADGSLFAREGRNLIYSLQQIEELYPELLSMEYLPYREAFLAAQIKNTKAKAGSTNPGVIMPEYIYFGEQNIDSHTNLYTDLYENLNTNENSNHRSKNFWVKVFGPIAGLFTGAAAAKHIANSNDSADCADQEVTAPALETQTFVAPINSSSINNVETKICSRFGYFPHDGKIAITATVAVVAGLSYITHKAYKNGFFSKLNLFGKTAVVTKQAPIDQDVKTEETPFVPTPIENAQFQENLVPDKKVSVVKKTAHN